MRTRTLLPLALAASALGASPAGAAGLDPTFSGDGIVVLPGLSEARVAPRPPTAACSSAPRTSR